MFDLSYIKRPHKAYRLKPKGPTEEELKEINKNIENLMIAIESGQNIDLISQRLTQKRAEAKEPIRQIDKEKSKLVNLSEEQIRFFLSQLKNGNINDIKYRKTLVNIFINRIYLYDKELTIIFNINNKRITVNTSLLDEITTTTNNAPSLFLNKLGQPTIKCLQ